MLFVEALLYIFAKCMEILLDFTMLCMMIRALLPIFMDVEENRFFTFAVVVTEPFIIPVRFIFYKLNIGQANVCKNNPPHFGIKSMGVSG